MKQNASRLVQRKFAQGVPIPVSSSPAAPTPPERKTDPPCPPKSVYHNNMSARCLLDIVASHNLHRHKQQPLVLLKRLREDEIPSLAKLPARKRRGLKTLKSLKDNKNKMALRSCKRKSPETPKCTTNRRKKNSSESTDDVPLAFYNKKRKQAQANKETLVRRETRSRTEEVTDKQRAGARRKPDEVRTRKAVVSQGAIMRRLDQFTSRLDSAEDSNFAFKEPKNPVRLSYRRFREQRAAAAAAKGRPLKKIVRPTSEVRSSPRSSANQRSSSEEPGVAKRLRNKLVLAEKLQSPAVSETAITPPTRVEPSPSLEPPESNSAPATPIEPSNNTRFDTPRCSMDSNREQLVDSMVFDIRFSMDSSRAQSVDSVVIAELIDTFNADYSMPNTELTATVSNTRDWCIQDTAEKNADSQSVMSESNVITINDVRTITPSVTSSDMDDTLFILPMKPEIVNPTNKIIESTTTEQYADSELETLNIQDTAEKNADSKSVKSESNVITINDVRTITPSVTSSDMDNTLFILPMMPEIVNPTNKIIESTTTEQYADSELETLNVQDTAEKNADSKSVKSESNVITINDVRTITPSVTSSDMDDTLFILPMKPEIVYSTNKIIESTTTEQYADSELETLNIMKEKINMAKRNDKGAKRNSESAEPREQVEKRSSRSCNSRLRIIGTKNTQKRNERQTASNADKNNKIITRGANTYTRETIFRFLKDSFESPQLPANPSPDVYEFDAEREASRPPSGLRARRNQPTPTEPSQPTPTIGETKEILAYFTSQKRREPSIPTATTAKDSISDEKKKALIENLSSSPSLLDKFLNCLSPEIRSEFDNLIAAEQASGEIRMDGKNEYLDPKTGSLMEALTFHPTKEEFEDPILYFEKIAPRASAHGLCKIVPPPGFQPPCNISDTIRFAVIYQYISKMYSRWGPVTRELAAIKAHLRTQSVVFARSPLLDGSEVNLPKLYHVVERHGGLNNVMQRKRWGRVADEMKLTKLQHPERKLDPIYMRYLLPYATLSDTERQTIMSEVEKYWTLKYQKMLKRARNPFQRQARMLSAETENESSDDERDDSSTAGALREAEDCTVPGRTMNLATFKKVATALMDAHFEPKSQPPNPIEVEKAYWRAVLLGTEHIVANTASIDTGEEGYGFPKDPAAAYGANPWNLKVLARNPNNVLRYLGQVLGVTVPTLHLNMLFSTSCWHRDPHGLPWIEYMHSGAEKIWYGIPGDESANFRRAVETLCPAYCQNKSIWLASEITMIPPNILSEHEVRLSRLIQRPGEYVLVFPEAHSCSITTGFGISESVYFASNTWLSAVYKLFQELRNSCEPTMFSLEQLLLNGSKDDSAPRQICTVLSTLLSAELEHRRALERKGLEVQERPASGAPLNTSYFRAWHTRDHDDECEYCRCTLYLSKVIGLTGRNSAVCPEHALRLLEAKKHKNLDLSTLEFLSSYSTRAIEEMVERLEARSGEQVPLIDLTTPTPIPTDDPQPGTSQQAGLSC